MTLREAVLAHDREARDSRGAFEALSSDDRNRVIEFSNSLQVVHREPTLSPMRRR